MKLLEKLERRICEITKRIIAMIVSMVGIGVAIYLSYLHGTIYEDHQGLIACSCFVGFCSAYFLIQNISRILKENRFKKSKE